jgi:uncharacterized damage-inducible protein DinB
MGILDSLENAASRLAGRLIVLEQRNAKQFSRVWLAFFAASPENPAMAHQSTTSYTKDAIELFRYYKRLADNAIAQCPDHKLCAEIDRQSNSIAIIVKHMAGNMRSRWTDFLTTDGEKPNRDRDTEFEAPAKTRAELIAMWEAGWKLLFDALTPLTDGDLARTITIRTEPHSAMQAINRQIAHYSYHIGQIVYLARHFAGSEWKTLTIPKKMSTEFNKKVASGELSQR